MNYEMAVTKPKSTGKYSSKKSGVNGHSMAHERVYSGGGREEFFFAGHDQTGQPSFVAMTRKFCAWLLAFTTGKTGCKWSHDYLAMGNVKSFVFY